MAKRPRTAAAPPIAAAARDWPVAALAIAAFAISVYLAATKLAGGAILFCEAGSGCDIVQASRYSVLLGVPTAFWGALLYAAMGVLALIGLPARRWVWAFLLAAAGVGFSAYMTYLSVVVLGVACVYCLASAAIALALLIVLLMRRPPVHGRTSPVRTGRLALLGPVTAAATVFAGAFIFAAPASLPAGYQAALARHLTETKAVMYGAFW